jgi:anti-anti-sigma factor
MSFIFAAEFFHTLAGMPDDSLTYSSTAGQHEGTEVLKLDGPLKLTTMFEFQGAFRAMTPKVLIVDLSDSPYMDSAGLGLLMNYYVSAQNHGRKILLACVNERIQALLELTKVDGILTSYPTVEAAEASLQS